jgi:DNA-binding SARP family transcriptional activator
VGCDLDRLARLIEAPLAEQRAALVHLRGQPFSGLRRFDWVLAEGHLTHASDVASALARSVASKLLESGVPDQAITALRRGISVNPYDESLWRLLLEATWESGNVVGLEPILTELAVILGATSKSRCGVSLDDAAALIHPLTWDTYCTLRGVGTLR